MRNQWLQRHRGALAMTALGLVLAAGLYQRLDNLGIWRSDPGRFFHDEEPLQMSVDGYHYLSLARALRDGRYEPVDENRSVPVGRPRPWPPPLLSTLTWLLSRMGLASLDWVAALLPAFLGVLLALPVYGLGIRLGGRLLGASAALFALASPFYVARTMLGWHDTDCLNVTFALAIPYLLLRFSEEPTRRRHLYLGAALATYLFFLWWWDHGRAPATFAFAIPLAVALGFEQRRRRLDRGWFGAALALLSVVVLALHGRELLGTALRATRYVVKQQVDAFPTSGANVLEQSPADLLAIADFAAGGPLTLAVAAVGVGCLVWRHPGRCLFLLFPFLVSCLSFRAIRFVLFMAPLVGLGVGAVLHELWQLRRGGRLGAVVVFALVAWPTLMNFDRDNGYRPRRHPFQVEAMTRMAAHTPHDAVIWADWAHGYPLQYYAERGTIADGAYHSGRLMYVLSVPLATSDFRLAANWIRFSVERGGSGMNQARALFGGEWSATATHLQRVFAAGPQGAVPILAEFGVVEAPQRERWLRLLFPSEGRPAYVFLDYDKIRTPWFTYGTWDFEQSAGKPFAYLPFSGLEASANRVRNREIEIDLVSGEARFQGRVLELARFAWKPPPETGIGLRVRDYERSGLAFQMDEASRSGVLLDDATAQSVGHRLFVGEGVDARYFRLALSRHPLYRVWEVRGDRYAGP